MWEEWTQSWLLTLKLDQSSFYLVLGGTVGGTSGSVLERVLGRLVPMCYPSGDSLCLVLPVG
jgi:hypothetical protein